MKNKSFTFCFYILFLAFSVFLILSCSEETEVTITPSTGNVETSIDISSGGYIGIDSFYIGSWEITSCDGSTSTSKLGQIYEITDNDFIINGDSTKDALFKHSESSFKISTTDTYKLRFALKDSVIATGGQLQGVKKYHSFVAEKTSDTTITVTQYQSASTYDYVTENASPCETKKL